MKYKIYSDLHWGQASEILTDVFIENGDIFLGDIWDIKNTSKKEIKNQLEKQETFRQKCKVIGAVYVGGNHDLRNDLIVFHKVDNVLFHHGHHACWDQSQVKEWEAKEPNGVGFFRRMTLAVQNLYSRGTWKPTQIEIDRAVKFAKLYFCDTIVIGHTHSDKIVDFVSDGIRIVNVPRGITEIEL